MEEDIKEEGYMPSDEAAAEEEAEAKPEECK